MLLCCTCFNICSVSGLGYIYAFVCVLIAAQIMCLEHICLSICLFLQHRCLWEVLICWHASGCQISWRSVVQWGRLLLNEYICNWSCCTQQLHTRIKNESQALKGHAAFLGFAAFKMIAQAPFTSLSLYIYCNHSILWITTNMFKSDHDSMFIFLHTGHSM